jgi:hypothetical protein
MNKKISLEIENIKSLHNSIKRNLKLGRLLVEIITVATLLNLLLISPAYSSITFTTAIASSGTFSNIASAVSALQVEGNKIKNSAGNVVHLCGVNQPDFANDADGNVLKVQYWSDSNAKAEIALMKNWGANTIRCFIAVDNWKYDLIDSTSALHSRDAIKRYIAFAGEQGLNVIITGYTLKSSRSVGGNAYQDPLPYPPYQTSPGGSSIISSQQDFVNFWVSVATELKSYQNVLFELWNEPQGSSSVLNAWLNVSQECITAIRGTGSQNLVLVSGNNWGSAWVDLSSSSREDLSWVFNYPLIGGNIVYNVHLYGQHIQRSGSLAYQQTDVDDALRLMRYYDVAAEYPLIVTEISPNMDTNTVNELIFFQNALNLLNQNRIHYSAWGWWSTTSYRLLTTEAPSFIPSSAGIVLQTALINA